MSVKIEDVKKLRTYTGAGLTACKEALEKANGDIAEAEKILQKEGLAASDARSGRPTSEGRVFVKEGPSHNKVQMFSVKCETDFVANSEGFKNIVNEIKDVEDLPSAIDKLKISMRENIQVGNFVSVNYNESCICRHYIHSNNKIGSIVVITDYDEDKVEKVKSFAYDCCLHAVAFTPDYLDKRFVPAEFIDEKKEIFSAQMDADPKMASKPDKVKEGILNGKINKALSEVCFLLQPFVKDDKYTVAEVLKRECGSNAKLCTYKIVSL